VSGAVARHRDHAMTIARRVAGALSPSRRGSEASIPMKRPTAAEPTAVDSYWSSHTVRALHFRTRRGSERELERRFTEYPLFREFAGLWGEHDGEVVLDYGCGPGNDLTGLALYSGARRLIGMDISARALSLARRRLALHGIAHDRVELIQAADSDPSLPLSSDSFDYVQSLGVIHHASDPAAVLRELHRVLRPGGAGCVMVYNQASVWFHLYTAYERMIRERAFPGLDVHEAFARNTDGERCPISRSYRSEEFAALCEEAAFDVEFVGGYLSRQELRSLKRSWAAAIADERLAREHRDFLRRLSFDPQNLPMHDGYHAGIGGVYRLRKPAAGVRPDGGELPLSSPSRRPNDQQDRERSASE